MIIAFDAKRAFNNKSGLGNYSRNLLKALIKFYPQNRYLLFTPKINELIFNDNGFEIYTPKGLNSIIPSIWRSFTINFDLKKTAPEIYHGLSNELPFFIDNKRIKTVVTIHDLIFLRYPELYRFFDRKIYQCKFKYACKKADIIIAISEQTKNDIIEFFEIEESKIKVVYQSCNPIFFENNIISYEQLFSKYKIPGEYILYVGTIEKRKNLLTLLKAIHFGKINIPIVVVGRKTKYFGEIMSFIKEKKLQNIFFIGEISNEELALLYKYAKVFVYPSIFEGFGIPVIEAIASGIPVITSNSSCLKETGGDAALYCDPNNHEDLANSILNIISNNSLRNKLIENGKEHIKKFTPEVFAKNIMNIYKELANYE